MKKRYIFLLLLLLTIGFASVNTVLDLNGKVDVSLLESDLDVVFKEVLLNNEISENVFIIENGKSFIYSADELTNENNTSNIDYVIMNQSHQYDVEVKVSCTTDYESYLSYNGTLDNQELPIEESILIEAREVKSGNVITNLIKENDTSESLVLKCTLDYIPISRDNIVNNEYLVSFDTGYEEQVNDIKVEYYEEYKNLPELTRKNYSFLGWYTEDDIKIENNSLVKIKENHTLKAKWLYTCPYNNGQVWTFEYTGEEQEFEVKCDGNYQVELWGAQGGANLKGGKGAYTRGIIEFKKKKLFILNIGSSTAGGYSQRYGENGGGATDLRIISGTTFTSLKTRIMVAGAGGGYASYSSTASGGYAGGLVGGQGEPAASTSTMKGASGGGTQVSGGQPNSYTIVAYGKAGGFGVGGNSSYASYYPYTGGGGGNGYYGGAGGSNSDGNVSAGGGGSSFISGHDGCDAIDEDSTETNIIHTGQPNHYLGYIFTETVMIDGAGYKWTTKKEEYVGMPTHDGTGTMTGNSGNGYAKITYLGD